jgi:hypothetical protein
VRRRRRRRTPGPEGRARHEWSVLSCKAPPQSAQHTRSRHRSYWPSMEGGLYGRGRIGRGGEKIGRMRRVRLKTLRTWNLLCYICGLLPLLHNCFSFVLLVLVGCFLIFFCIKVCSLHILWRLCWVVRPWVRLGFWAGLWDQCLG